MSIEEHSNTELPSPITQLPAQDIGAETFRNFCYQSAYAVVLLVAAAAGKRDYIAVWCEQEDDVLAQIDDKSFDAYQVKTRKPENGKWNLTDDAFVSAINGFLRLNKRFPGRFKHFNFVTNVESSESDASATTHLSPQRLVSAVLASASSTALSDPETKGFNALLAKVTTKTTPEELFAVLQKFGFAKLPPSRESFVAELAQNHLRQLDWCRLPQDKLEPLVRDMISMVTGASSLSAQDAARHLPRHIEDGQPDPQLTFKRITVDEFVLRSRDLTTPTFRYLPTLTTQPLKQTGKDKRRFDLKLKRGGLDNNAYSLRTQLLSAEAIFLEMATRGPETEAELVQIENVVKTECDDAQLRAAQGAAPYGQRMLISVQDRLRQIAKSEPGKVAHQPYEALMGMAGILTESCLVWWSDKFDLEEKS